MTNTPDMTLGPVQLVVIELENDKLHGQISRELNKLRDNGMVRIIDLLFVAKGQDGSLSTIEASDLTSDQRLAYGAVIGGLLGLEAAGEPGAEVGAEVGALEFADRTFGLSDEDIRDMATVIPRGKSALFILFEHQWAIGIKEAVQEGNGVVRAQGFVRPETLALVSGALTTIQEAMNQPEQGQTPLH
jgi:uncharacterized membrane protein